MAQTRALFSHWGYDVDDFADQLIVDLGAGSKLRSKCFRRARIVAIEPLANRFRESLSWSDLYEAERVYSVGAETVIPELDGSIAFIMCVNVLDHVYDYSKVLRNAYRMLKPGGELLLSVDLHSGYESDLMHPVNLDRSQLCATVCQAGFSILREYDGLPLPNSDNYGHGRACTLVGRKPLDAG
jgi:SAM-dependent methyltransferase